MCDKCKEELKLVGYKWSASENLIMYKYQCEKCGEEKIEVKQLTYDQLKETLINEDLYNKFNL